MEKGFKYIDLNNQNLVGTFRPHPSSNPLEIYVAIINPRHEPNRNTPDLEIYRLITRANKYSKKRELVKKDGKNLAVQVIKGDIFDSMRKHYGVEVARRVEWLR